MMPTAASFAALADKESLRTIYFTGTEFLFSIYVAAAVCLMLFGGSFARLWIGQSFPAIESLLVVLLLGSMIQALNSVVYPILMGSGDLGVFRRVMLMYPLMSIGLSFLLLRPLGLMGAALATTLSCVIAEVQLTRHILRRLELTTSDLFSTVLRPGLMAAVPAGNSWVRLA